MDPVAAISLILFDLNGVLYRYNRDARIAYLASISQRPAAAIKTATWDSGFEDLGECGRTGRRRVPQCLANRRAVRSSI